MSAPKPIRMRPADYERALRLAADVRVAELELAAIVERAKHKIAALRGARDAHMKALSRRYRGFSAENVQYRPEDATCTMHPIQPPNGGPQ